MTCYANQTGLCECPRCVATKMHAYKQAKRAYAEHESVLEESHLDSAVSEESIAATNAIVKSYWDNLPKGMHIDPIYLTQDDLQMSLETGFFWGLATGGAIVMVVLPVTLYILGAFK